MDLIVLKGENLHEEVMQFINKELGNRSKTLIVLRHDADITSYDASKIRHVLYLLLEDEIVYCSSLVNITWTEYVDRTELRLYLNPSIYEMYFYNLSNFMKMLPSLSDLFNGSH